MQPAVNGCSVWGNSAPRFNHALSGWLGAVHHGLSGRAAPQVSRRRWTDGRKKNFRLLRSQEQEHRAASGIGVMRFTSVMTSRERALSNGGARKDSHASRWFGRQPSNRGPAPSARRRPEILHRGHPITAGLKSKRRWLSQMGRVVSKARDDRAASTGRALHAPAPSFRSIRVGASTGRARLARRAGCRRRQVGPSIVSVPRRSAGSPSRRGAFGRRGPARAHVGSGCHSVDSRRTATCLTCHRFGLGQWARRRAVWRVIRPSRLSRARSQTIAHSSSRPTTHCSRRTALLTNRARSNMALRRPARGAILATRSLEHQRAPFAAECERWADEARPDLVLTEQRYEVALDSCDNCRPHSRGRRWLGASADGGRIARSGSHGRRSPHPAKSGRASERRLRVESP
jgi:hypothetical protein